MTFLVSDSNSLFTLEDFSKKNYRNSGIWHDDADGFEYYLDLDQIKKEDLTVSFNYNERTITVIGLINPEIYVGKMMKKKITLPKDANVSITAMIDNDGRLKIYVPKQENIIINIPIMGVNSSVVNLPQCDDISELQVDCQ
jgi:hypothetical protein